MPALATFPIANLSVVLLIGAPLIFIPLYLLTRDLNRVLAEEKERSKSPFSEKLLRPPGETLRLKIDEIQSGIMDHHFSLALLVMLPGLLIILFSSVALPVALGTTTLATAICFPLAGRKWRAIKKLRTTLQSYRLGFDGERYVASELNGLMRSGYHVFHDFIVDWKPGGEETNFNIDHIVVGPNGVIAVETKAWRKQNAQSPTGQPNHKLTFTGEALVLPSGYQEQSALRQAARNAETLSKWLTGTAPAPVSVQPLVVVPGWFVESKGQGPVHVLSGKGVAKRIPGLPGGDSLPPDQLRQLADRIEAHCRNVEGT